MTSMTAFEALLFRGGAFEPDIATLCPVAERQIIERRYRRCMGEAKAFTAGRASIEEAAHAASDALSARHQLAPVRNHPAIEW
jgi:hypothetical protein